MKGLLTLLLMFLFFTTSVFSQNEAITYGSSYTFTNNSILYADNCQIDETHFVTIYVINSTCVAKVGTISGTTITYGAEYQFSSSSGNYLKIRKLSSTSFVITFLDTNISGLGTAMIGTVSNNDVISFGVKNIFQSDYLQANYISNCILDATHIVVVYKDNISSGRGTAKIGTISGTTITFGDPTQYTTVAAYYHEVSALTNSSFVIACSIFSTGGLARIGTISGNTITFGNNYFFNGNASYSNVSVVALSSTKIAVLYRDETTATYYGVARIGTVVGTAITYGSNYTYATSAIGNANSQVIKINATKFLISFQNTSNSTGQGIIGTLSGTNIISYNSISTFNSYNTLYLSSTAMNDFTFVTSFGDSRNSNYGTAVVGTIPQTIIGQKINNITYRVWNNNSITKWNNK